MAAEREMPINMNVNVGREHAKTRVEYLSLVGK
jgi:hypothetical protein